MTLWIGLAVVVVSSLALVPMLFPGGPEPATLENMHERAIDEPMPTTRRSTARPTVVRVPETVVAAPPWWQRVRGAVGLLVLCTGLACALATVAAVAILIAHRTIL